MTFAVQLKLFGTMGNGIRIDLAELLSLERQVGGLRAAHPRRVRELQAGSRASPFRGRGMDYAETRLYSNGDDVRHIDWRVTARSGRLHTKLFQAERERTTAVVFDHSESMNFGTRVCFKSVQAARLAALLLWLASGEGDRLAVASIRRDTPLLPPTGGRRGLLRALQALVEWQAQPVTDEQRAPLRAVIDQLVRVLRPGSHVFLVVDPRHVDAPAAAALSQLRAHSDVVAALVVDPLELATPAAANYLLSDGSRRCRLPLHDSEVRRVWQSHFQDQLESARGLLRRSGVLGAVVSCADDPVRTLRDLLRGRVSKTAA